MRSAGRSPGGVRSEERRAESGRSEERGAREATSSSTGHRYLFSGPLVIVSGISGVSGVSGASGISGPKNGMKRRTKTKNENGGIGDRGSRFVYISELGSWIAVGCRRQEYRPNLFHHPDSLGSQVHPPVTCHWSPMHLYPHPFRSSFLVFCSYLPLSP